jgi:hypothetical protein
MARPQNAASSARDNASDNGNVPDDPTDLSGGSWLAAGKRALKEYKADDLQDRAAALTYYGIQSISPACSSWFHCSACSATQLPSR